MSDYMGLTVHVSMRGREVIFTTEEHTLAVLPDRAGAGVGIRWDGQEVRPAIDSFVTWDDAGEAEFTFFPDAAQVVGVTVLGLTVINDAIEAFEVIYALLDEAGAQPMDVGALTAYNEALNADADQRPTQGNVLQGSTAPIPAN